MTARFRFVDSISATAGVRLDLQVDPDWGVLRDGLDLTPAALRTVSASSMLTDGAPVVASARDNMLLRMPVLIKGTTDDGRRNQLGLLAREVDRVINFLEIRLRDLTDSRWLRCYRSSIVGFEPHYGQSTWRAVLQIEADPWASGLRHDVQAETTVTNDPAAATRGMLLDITGVLGDLPTPAFMWHSAGDLPPVLVATRSTGVPADLVWFHQAEAMTAGTDVGAATADATASGGSRRTITSFSTSTMLKRLESLWPATSPTVAQLEAMIGSYRVLVRVRKSVSGDTIQMQHKGRNAYLEYSTGPVQTLASGTGWQIVDLGVLDFPLGMTHRTWGSGGVAVRPSNAYVEIYAAQTTGSGGLDFDFVALVPADESFMSVANANLIDGPQRTVYHASPNMASSIVEVQGAPAAVVKGGVPFLMPGVTNRLWWIQTEDAAITATAGVSVSYWPRYLSV